MNPCMFPTRVHMKTRLKDKKLAIQMAMESLNRLKDKLTIEHAEIAFDAHVKEQLQAIAHAYNCLQKMQ